MTGTDAAINILNDVVFTIQGTTGGDDGNSTRTLTGTALTFLVDKVSWDDAITLSDHSTAQSGPEFNRRTKSPQKIDIETKLAKKANAALLTLLRGNTGIIVKFTATAAGCNIVGTGIVEGLSGEYAAPSTLKFSLRQYGTAFDINAT